MHRTGLPVHSEGTSVHTAGSWNARYPPGTPVIVTIANGKRIRTETLGDAVRVGQFDMIPVAAIQPGSVLLSWCWPVKTPPGAVPEGK